MQKVVWVLIALVGVLVAMASIAVKSDSSVAGYALLLGSLAGLVYFIPALIAARRGHPNATAIVVLNAIAGWTFLGWVSALTWSLIRIKPEVSTK